METMTVKVKSVYGNTLYYPVCHNARTLASITGTKTLTRYVLVKARDLGFEILFETDEAEVL